MTCRGMSQVVVCAAMMHWRFEEPPVISTSRNRAGYVEEHSRSLVVRFKERTSTRELSSDATGHRRPRKTERMIFPTPTK